MKKKLIPVLLDPELVTRFESPEAINAALRILVDAAQLVRSAKVKTRAPRPKTKKVSEVNVPDADYVVAVDAMATAPSPNARLRRAVRRARSLVAR
jgi:hypothetical protein